MGVMGLVLPNRLKFVVTEITESDGNGVLNWMFKVISCTWSDFFIKSELFQVTKSLSRRERIFKIPQGERDFGR